MRCGEGRREGREGGGWAEATTKWSTTNKAASIYSQGVDVAVAAVGSAVLGSFGSLHNWITGFIAVVYNGKPCGIIHPVGSL